MFIIGDLNGVLIEFVIYSVLGIVISIGEIKVEEIYGFWL